MRTAKTILELIGKRLCKRCHVAVEHGLPITWQLISLDEIKERRKKLNDAILESRMQ